MSTILTMKPDQSAAGAFKTLKGHYALVTGGSRGIGYAVAKNLAAAGCNVAISSRNRKDIRAAALRIEKSGARALGIAADISRQAGVHDMFRELHQWSGGRLDILVCNAGFPFLPEIWNTPLHSTPVEKLESWYIGLFKTDTLGSVFCTFEALPLMIRHRRGSIIYIASTPALEGFQGTPYTVAKAGILGLMKDVARTYGKYHIRANALALGNILTPATSQHMDAPTRKALAKETPLRRWGEPDEVGQAVLFLASAHSSFITGQTIVVDGGTVRW
jgi:NAD(P)-dependent dehydrogenase (short-subunit alcohol dehydrogenase family)